MPNIKTSRFLLLFLSFSLLIGPLPLSAIAEDIIFNLSEQQIHTTENDVSKSYVYLGKKLSNIADIVSHVSELDKNEQSSLHKLKNYIDQGFLFIKYNDIIEILKYAQSVIHKRHHLLNCDYITEDLEKLIHQIMDGALTIDSAVATRALRTLIINENIDVIGKSIFHKHVKTKQGIHALGKLKVDKNARLMEIYLLMI